MIGMTASLWIVLILCAAVVDWSVGDPAWLPHPIVYIGRLIGLLTQKLNRGKGRKAKGLLLWIVTICITMLVTCAVQYLAYKVHILLLYAVNIWFLSTTLAAKCLKQEVGKVSQALAEKDLPKARKMVGYLVGRDTNALEEGGIIRATVETTAENTIDGVLAPLFYMLVGTVIWQFNPFLNPLVLAMAYKAVNTMDSMVGYIQEPYRDFGFFPAKLDDVFNYPIARIGSIFMLIGGFFLGFSYKNGFEVYKRDKTNHKSPNSGHPESVVAGLLGIQLGGTNQYFGQVLEKPTMGEAKHDLSYEDIKDSIGIMYAAESVMLGLTAAVTVIFSCFII